MARTRAMFYHNAGEKAITVEVVSRATVDGEDFEKRENIRIESKVTLDKLGELLALIDAEAGIVGDDPVTAARFAVPVAEVTPEAEVTP